MATGEMRRRLLRAKVPQRYWYTKGVVSDVESYKIRLFSKLLKSHVKAGDGLYVVGVDLYDTVEPLVAALCKTSLKMGYPTLWVNAEDARCAQRSREQFDEDWLLHNYLEQVSVLALMNFGEELVNDFWLAQLTAVLRKRHDYHGATIITSELTAAQVESRYNQTLMSILDQNFKVVDMRGDT